jgi:hypothetical protein
MSRVNIRRASIADQVPDRQGCVAHLAQQQAVTIRQASRIVSAGEGAIVDRGSGGFPGGRMCRRSSRAIGG